MPHGHGDDVVNDEEGVSQGHGVVGMTDVSERGEVLWVVIGLALLLFVVVLWFVLHP